MRYKMYDYSWFMSFFGLMDSIVILRLMFGFLAGSLLFPYPP